MKVNELQIGDYVNYGSQIIKATSLYDKGGSNEIGWSDKERVWVNAYNVEPIPLTLEILEKNGFLRCVKGTNNFWCLETLSTFYIDVSVKDNDDYTFWIRVANMYVQIKYVHQLQHILRGSGIEHEINV